VELIVQQRTGRPSPGDFRSDLDSALQAYDAIAYLQAQGGPKLVRANLKRARDSALRLNERLNDLDGKSRQILSGVPNGEVAQLYSALETIIMPLAEAYKIANGPPHTRAGLTNHAPLNLGQFLAEAIDRHFGRKFVSSSHNGLFAQIYGVLAEELGIASHHRAVRAALKFWQDTTPADDAVDSSSGKNPPKFSSE
jgi:hypothetical protein